MEDQLATSVLQIRPLEEQCAKAQVRRADLRLAVGRAKSGCVDVGVFESLTVAALQAECEQLYRRRNCDLLRAQQLERKFGTQSAMLKARAVNSSLKPLAIHPLEHAVKVSSVSANAS